MSWPAPISTPNRASLSLLVHPFFFFFFTYPMPPVVSPTVLLILIIYHRDNLLSSVFSKKNEKIKKHVRIFADVL